jgi:tetratricopeptide (TPR) repeat protein
LAKVAYLRGQYARAKVFQEQSLAIFRELGERQWIVGRLDALGEVALASGDLEQARTRYREALSLAEELAAMVSVERALCGLGDVALAAGDVLAARQHYRRALQVAMEAPRVDAGRRALISLAKLVAHRGKRGLAVELLTLAFDVRPDLWHETLRGTEALQGELRSGLSPEAYAAAQARGRGRDLEATLRELLADLEA